MHRQSGAIIKLEYNTAGFQQALRSFIEIWMITSHPESGL